MEFPWLTGVYNTFKEDLSIRDQRTQNLPLMQNDILLLTILAAYVLFCAKLGPKLMENRKPFQLKNTLFVYNSANVVISIWMTYEMARLVYIYFICKLVELLDTVFFVLRKKNKQVTFLHLYHHTAMPIYTFMSVRIAPGGGGTLGILLNCFVHSVMYSYYLLAGLGPQYQKYLWWKSHLTKMQLLQFVVVLVQQFTVLLTDCKVPKSFSILYIANVTIITILFLIFYKRSYIKSAEKIAKSDNKVD